MFIVFVNICWTLVISKCISVRNGNFKTHIVARLHSMAHQWDARTHTMEYRILKIWISWLNSKMSSLFIRGPDELKSCKKVEFRISWHTPFNPFLPPLLNSSLLPSIFCFIFQIFLFLLCLEAVLWVWNNLFRSFYNLKSSRSDPFLF